ncbi:MAG: DUF3500 domain-containing protein [Bryobacteraceae bacterium]|nr:DUF3500 domain-containing protein [Bryobacteraceae bacterium]
MTSVSLFSFHDHEEDAAPAMTDAASNFLASLTPEQSAKAKFAFADEERYNWHFIPRERKGLAVREMSPHQKHLASALLSAALSQRGYIKATTIMSLEDVLRILEKDSGERRNPEKYYFSIFGEPSEKEKWGLRVEGHHVSLNFTLANGRVVGAPNFFGANPAEVREGPRKGLRVLHGEEDSARSLMQMLTPEQKNVAVVTKTAYKDILTEASRKAALAGQPSGLSAEKMTARQREALHKVINHYVYNVPDSAAKARAALVAKAGNKLLFAWAGVEEKGGPHYYRIQGADFLIEYDNTQNDSNHIHSVWRELSGDWGADLLGQHYNASKHDHR